ncbi:FAD-dependent oxidoreductase, partial [Nocardioides jensenii]|uniref:FAD-dependent oxidoreductase n=1 Tax=Nocardioides jensenii TaxID=1843 RepID=UPI000A646466
MSEAGIVIVGAGQASAVAARTLRRRKYAGPITIVGDETERPYQRPPLTKEFLVKGDDDGLYLLPEQWTEDNAVEVRTGVRAVEVCADGSGVKLDDGTTLPADKVLLATGGSPR